MFHLMCIKTTTGAVLTVAIVGHKPQEKGNRPHGTAQEKTVESFVISWLSAALDYRAHDGRIVIKAYSLQGLTEIESVPNVIWIQINVLNVHSG